MVTTDVVGSSEVVVTTEVVVAAEIVEEPSTSDVVDDDSRSSTESAVADSVDDCKGSVVTSVMAAVSPPSLDMPHPMSSTDSVKITAPDRWLNVTFRYSVLRSATRLQLLAGATNYQRR